MEALKRTFRWFSALGPDEVVEDGFGKRSLFICALDERSDVTVSDKFIGWGFSHLTADGKDAKELARLLRARNWNAPISERPIRAKPGETLSVRIDVTEPGEKAFAKGLGTHANSEIVFDIGGKYKMLESYIGVTGHGAVKYRAGSISFEVVLDGKSAYTSPVLLGGGPYKHIKIDVSGVHELVHVRVSPAS